MPMAMPVGESLGQQRTQIVAVRFEQECGILTGSFIHSLARYILLLTLIFRRLVLLQPSVTRELEFHSPAFFLYWLVGCKRPLQVLRLLMWNSCSAVYWRLSIDMLVAW